VIIYGTQEIEEQAQLKEKAIQDLHMELEKARAAIEVERQQRSQLELVNKQLEETKSAQTSQPQQQEEEQSEKLEAAQMLQLQQDLEARKKEIEELLKKTAPTEGLQEELRCSICSSLYDNVSYCH